MVEHLANQIPGPGRPQVRGGGQAGGSRTTRASREPIGVNQGADAQVAVNAFAAIRRSRVLANVPTCWSDWR
jgi:hypothetical protein